MELIRGAHNLQPRHQGCAATIGNFDGVHLGHRAILAQLAQRAAALRLPSALITFEPLPQEYFLREKAPARLMSLREKWTALRALPLDRLLVLHFGARLAELSAEDFIGRLLVEKLGVRYLAVGDDFRFGAARRGDFTLLQDAGREYGFQVERAPTVTATGARVSSTRVRAALKDGDMTEAERLLGHPYALCGHVARGDRRGRELGYPTANLKLRRSPPVRGIFAVEVLDVDEAPLHGVASLGRRPMFETPQELLEVHLFDFDGDLYGRKLQVNLRHKLRDEMRFDGFDTLKRQIAADVQQARDYFNTR